MIRPIVRAGDPILRTPSKKVEKIDKKIQSLIHDMKETLLAQKDPEGIGLAAPQIGKNIQLFLMRREKDILVMMNPEILVIKKSSKKKKKTGSLMEGCLSLPHFYSPILRSYSLTLRYMDETGNTKTEEFKGLDAHIIQHEIDHLKGVLFVDRILEQKLPLYEYKDDEWYPVDLPIY